MYYTVDSFFFDYHAKYTPGACNEITPAEIPDEVARKVQKVALCVHETVGCRHLSRSDMIIRGDEPVWIEVNTLPGMTELSLVPMAAAEAGLPFDELVERICLMARERGR